MTPSQAHDSAYRRDPNHDEMQLAILRWFRVNKAPCHQTHRKVPASYELPFVGATAERLFTYRLSGYRTEQFFADVAVHYRGEPVFQNDDGSDYRMERCHWLLLEVKPRIYNAGALIRQVRAQRDHAAAMWGAPDGRYIEGDTWEVRPVVMAHDPLAQTVADMADEQVGIWDGTTLAWLRPTGQEAAA